MKREPPSIGSFSVVMVDRQRKHDVRKSEIRRVLQLAAASLKVEGELALVFAGDGLLRRLNRDYRFKDKPTDVLSFPSPDRSEGLGDVVISVETARKNARGLGRSLDRELEILALHGFLHVLGYDHETDNGEMEALEKQLRRRHLSRTRRSSAVSSRHSAAGARA
jgi:probable rRNA maturation factor